MRRNGWSDARRVANRWTASVATVSLVLASLVGTAAVGVSVLAGPAGPASADSGDWSISLSTDEATFAEGDSPYLTSVSNQSLSDFSGAYAIYLFDLTAGTQIMDCGTGTTCGQYAGFDSGPAHNYEAVVADAGQSTASPSGLTDIQATSNVVTETHETWTVSLTSTATTIAAGEYATLTATTNQDISRAGNRLMLLILDETDGSTLSSCYYASTSCSADASFFTGPPQTYVAVVVPEADADGRSFSSITDAVVTSNTVVVSRAGWTLSLSGTTSMYVTGGGNVLAETTLTAVANQDTTWTGNTYHIVIVDYTTGQVVSSCTSRTFTCVAEDDHFASEGPQSYVAYVAQYQWWSTPPIFDIQVTSGSYSTPTAMLASEIKGGPNKSEKICPCTQGDPVNTATGEFYEDVTDDAITGVGPALSVGRTYSSTGASVDGPFGYGWSTSFGASLSVLAAGDTDDPLPRAVQITQENGSTVQFLENADQTYSAQARVQATLVWDAGTSTWIFTRQKRDILVFDSSGELTALKDLHGNTVTFSYTSGKVTSITGSGSRAIDLTWTGSHVTGLSDSAGRSVTYAYDGSGNLTSVAAVDGSVTSYGYDSSHLLTTLTKPDGGVTTNTYNSSDQVVAQEDPVGRVTTFDYSGSDTYVVAPDSSVTVDEYSGYLLTSQTKAAGETYAETTAYTYDDADNTTSVTDPLGKVTSYTYDSDGNRLTQTDPLDRTTTSTYDALGDVLTVTDPMSREASATYDSAGDKLSATSPSGRVQHWTYNTDGTVATSEDARGKTTTYGYNSAGDPTAVTDPDSRESTTAYNSAGIMTSTTDPGSNTTTYTTDAAGRVLTATDPNSHTTTYTYDADGNKTSVENAGGHTTSYAYDDADQLTSTTVPGSHTTTYTYTDAGQPASTTDPDGHTSSTAYNALGLLTSSTNADGKVTHYGYDGDGRQTSETLPSGAESTVAYDDAGQKTSSTDALGKTTTYAYDDDGEVTSTTDPLSRVTGASYTADGQVHIVTLPDSSTETSTYNTDGQLTDFENADGAHTTYVYDDAGLPTSKTEPGSITTAYTYTTAGQVHVTTNPDATTVTDSYNAGGLLTAVAYSASSAAAVSYSYDADNLRTGMTDATGTSSYSYNSRGLMTSQTNGNGTTLGYGYDNASQLTSITYPGSKTVSYGYDNAGQMTSLTDWSSNETDFTWTDNGLLHTQADPNGITQTRNYDADGRTTDIATANSSSTIADYGYGYDDDGELTSDSTTDPNNSTALTHTYSYDALTQLTTINDGTTSSSYTDTPAGEVTGNTAGSTLAYNTAQELTSLTPGSGPSTSFVYDANGDRTSSTVAATSTTSAATTGFTFDAAGDLASVDIPASGSTAAEMVDYTSDGDGLRQSRTVGTATKQFLWDTNSSLPLLLDDGTNSYLYGPSSAPIAQVNDSTGAVKYLSDDLIGSTRLITNSSGAVVGVNIYNEYGNLSSHTGSTTSAIGYSGNWTDPDTGLVYLRARDYDPVTAQFLTVDPLVDTTRQPYAYVVDDPLSRTDSNGLICSSSQTAMTLASYTAPNLDDTDPSTNPWIALASAGIAAGVAWAIDDEQAAFDVGTSLVPDSIFLALLQYKTAISIAVEYALPYTWTGLQNTTAYRYALSSISGTAARLVAGAGRALSSVGGSVTSAGSKLLTSIKSVGSSAVRSMGNAIRSVGASKPAQSGPAQSAEPTEVAPESPDITTLQGSNGAIASAETEEDSGAFF